MALSKITNDGVATSGLPAGSVLQVVVERGGGSIFSTTSTSYTSTGLSASITPASTSSKILVMLSSRIDRPGVAGECTRLRVSRDSGAATLFGTANNFYTTDSFDYSGVSVYYEGLDEPATTTSVTYLVELQTRLGNSCSSNSHGNAGNPDTLTLIEIAG